MSRKGFHYTWLNTDPIPTSLKGLPFHPLTQKGEIMLLITLVVITLLCLVFPSTRIYSIVGTGMLLFLYPLWAIGLLLAAGIVYQQYREKLT
jgi:hypothetical protein